MKAMSMFTVTTFVLCGALRADEKKEDEKPLKADVVVKSEDKSAKAKVGEVVQFDVKYPVVPPLPSDFKVLVDGKEVKAEERTNTETANGRPVVGVGIKSLYVKFDKAGTKKVVVEYKKGKDDAKREVEVEVSNK